MDNATCSTVDCGRTVVARGYCKACHKRARAAGTIARVRRSNADKSCDVADCERSAQRRGWCAAHYQRWYKTGSVEDKRRPRPSCSIEGCSKPHLAGGHCSQHYYRLKRHGDVDYRSRAANGEGHTDERGYVHITMDHPVTTACGVALMHRVVLYDSIGPGPHKCWWCPAIVDWNDGLTADHLDWNRSNNDPQNLVPSCLACNSSRHADEKASVVSAD